MNRANSAPRMTSEEAVLQMRSKPELAALVEACYFDDPIFCAAKRFAISNEWNAIKKILSPKWKRCPRSWSRQRHGQLCF